MRRSRLLQNIIANQSSDSMLLDTYSGAVGAYSLRYLSSSFTGDVVLVRRSSDNAEQGFTPTEITDGTLVTFCGAGDGLVKTWYDQSGNANNAGQVDTSLQPAIVTNGALNLENTNPTIKFNSNSCLSNSDINSGQPNTFFVVCNKTDHSGYLYDGITSRQAQGDSTWIFAGAALFGAYPTVNLGNQIIFRALYKNPSESFAHINGVQTVSGSASSLALNGLVIGSYHARTGIYLNGNIQEFFIYPTDESVNSTGIESNINNYYNVF